MLGPVDFLFPQTAAAAISALRAGSSADALAGALAPAVTAEQGQLLDRLAEQLLRRLTERFRTVQPTHTIPAAPSPRARRNGRRIADELMAGGVILPPLLKWLSANLTFWLWRGDGLDSIDAAAVGALVQVFLDSQIELLAESLSPPRLPLPQLADILAIPPLPSPAPSAASDKELPPGMLLSLSDQQFQALRDALGKGQFTPTLDTPWPTARLADRATAQLRPPTLDQMPWLPAEGLASIATTMWRQQGELSDRDADLLDALCSLYLGRAERPDQPVTISIDELLHLRGLRPKKGGGGRRGGFESEQRMEIVAALGRLQSLWLDIAALPVLPTDDRRPGPDERLGPDRILQSRAFLITDRIGRKRPDGSLDVERFLLRPGLAFSAFLFHGRRHLLFAQALHYDPYRYRWEKRLTRYLSWHWGDGGGHCHSIRQLLEVAADPARVTSSKRRARLEQAMTRLRDDGIVAAWHYQPTNDGKWDDGSIFVQAPSSLTAYYAQDSNGPPMGARVAQRRKALRLTQAALATKWGLTQSHLSKIENGQAQPNAELAARFEAWLHAATPEDGGD